MAEMPSPKGSEMRALPRGALLATKLAIPPVRRGTVLRARLLERIDGGLERRLTLVSAPAGFGKTTLLCVWAHALQPAHAAPFIEQAARDGAQIIVLPELAATGYYFNAALWDVAETCKGRIVEWVKETSRRLGVYLGIGYVEADGEDFYNTYVIGAPEGEVAGQVRKTQAEAYIFKREPGPHVIPTTLGKVGVGICADSHFLPMPQLMQEQSVDLMLMPHAWPGPVAAKVANKREAREDCEKARGLAPFYVQLLGVPAVFINQVGPIGAEKWPGIIGKLLNREVARIMGLSRIVDGDGTVKAELGVYEEGVIVADVTLDPARKRRSEARGYGRMRFLRPTSPVVDAIISIDKALGIRWYERSAERKAKARAVSS